MRLVAETLHPSFLATHPSGKFLYATNEHEAGRGPNHVAVDATGKTPSPSWHV